MRSPTRLAKVPSIVWLSSLQAPQDHPKQIATLAGLASNQMDASSFFGLVGTPGRFTADIRGRLDQVQALVRLALQDLGVADPAEEVVRQRTWELLSRLTVLMPRLEAPDEADWGALANALTRVARGSDLYGASRLRDRLVVLASEYPQNAASVDRSLLRRHAHEVLDSSDRRHAQGRGALDHLNARAPQRCAARSPRRIAVASSIWTAPIYRPASLRSSHRRRPLWLRTATLELGRARRRSDGDGRRHQRHPTRRRRCASTCATSPKTSLEFESYLGAPLATLLAELSAPQRLLIIDGADAISEGMGDVFRYVVDAAVTRRRNDRRGDRERRPNSSYVTRSPNA